VGEADVHIARDGQISFTPKTNKTPKPSRLFDDPVEEEEDEEEDPEEVDDNKEDEDDLVPYNSLAVLAALQSLQEKIRALESERDFYKKNYREDDSGVVQTTTTTTSKDEEISSLRQRIRNVLIEREEWKRKYTEMESLVQKQKPKEKVSRKKSKIKIELEIARDRLEQSEISRRKLKLRCNELEAENRILRFGDVERDPRSLKGTVKKKKKRKKKMKIKSPPYIPMSPPRARTAQHKKKSPTIHERLKTANKTRTIPFIPSGNAQISHSLIGRVQTKLAEDRYRDPRQCNASHAEDVKIASLSVLRRLREIV
jgi:hypothetical protein